MTMFEGGQDEQLRPGQVIYENPSTERNPSVQALLDKPGFPRLSYLVVYDPYVQGVAPCEDLQQAQNTAAYYAGSDHREVKIYKRIDLDANNWTESIVDAEVSPKISLPNDPVNHPPHYTFSKFEVIEVLTEWFPTNPLLWQVCKYIARAGHKDNYLQDLEKAKWYLEREIEETKKTVQDKNFKIFK